jgi:hypothetical protein
MHADVTVAANVTKYASYDLYFTCIVLYAVTNKSVIIFDGTTNFWDYFNIYIILIT